LGREPTPKEIDEAMNGGDTVQMDDPEITDADLKDLMGDEKLSAEEMKDMPTRAQVKEAITKKLGREPTE